VGTAAGNWVQFYDTTTRCAHGGSNRHANDCSVGIEVEGRNEDVMTDWQVSALRQIVDWLHETHGIDKTYRFGTDHNSTADHGYLPHSAVAGAEHTDYWTEADWERIVGHENGDDEMTPDQQAILVQQLAELTAIRTLSEDLLLEARKHTELLAELRGDVHA
jgi:N-acetyl-anhydromuramyl-L-alanine amidase AmpD